jgi:serine O-acetyltransferase
MFDTLLRMNCHSESKLARRLAANLLEKLYGCEIRCDAMDASVRFAHHARGCTIVAAKLCANVVIFQNVTIGTNLKYNKRSGKWENVGNPIISENVVILDGAKILGPLVVGRDSVIAAGAIVTRDVPAASVAFGVNQFKPKDPNYDLGFNANMLEPAEIIDANEALLEKFEQTR